MAGSKEVIVQRYKDRFEKLAANLRRLGYVFSETPVIGPHPQCEELIAAVEKELGPVPATLKEFYRVVGGINFMGRHPEWNFVEYPDPIVVLALDEVHYEFAEFLQDKDRYLEERGGKFFIPIAPDYYHKEDVSGGMWYNVAIPNGLEDPVIAAEPHKLPFTQYLDHALANGGFCSLDGRGQELGYPMDKILDGV